MDYKYYSWHAEENFSKIDFFRINLNFSGEVSIDLNWFRNELLSIGEMDKDLWFCGSKLFSEVKATIILTSIFFWTAFWLEVCFYIAYEQNSRFGKFICGDNQREGIIKSKGWVKYSIVSRPLCIRKKSSLFVIETNKLFPSSEK